MVWSPGAVSLIGFVVAVVPAVVALKAWHSQPTRETRLFVTLMATLGLWSAVYAVQLGYSTAEGQMVWQRVSLAVGGTVPAAWFIFVGHYAGWPKRHGRAWQLALIAEAGGFALLSLTNPAHGLIWTHAAIADDAAVQVLDLALGPGYYVHITIAYLVVAAGIAMLGSMYVQAWPLYRTQAGLLILAALPPFLSHIAFTLDVTWGPLGPLDLTPFAFVVTGLVMGVALYQFDLLQRSPVARRVVLDEMGDGLVVLDSKGHVVDANTVAHTAFDGRLRTGHPVTALVDDATHTPGTTLEALDGRTLTVAAEPDRRVYDVTCSTLTDRHGFEAGHVLALRDVTGRHRYQQRLEVAQRILRHNLRNELNVVRGWAERLRQAGTVSPETAAGPIIATVDDLIDLSEKTQRLVDLDDAATGEWTPVDVGDRLDRILAGVRAEHPEVRVEAAVDDVGSITLPDPSFLEVPVANLVENAIEHNDHDNPWVGVEAERDGDRIRIRVADNGPAIPAMERQVLADGTESPLHHGSGIGLWLAYWSLSTVGGSIEFATREPRGNRVDLIYPRRESDCTSVGTDAVPSPSD